MNPDRVLVVGYAVTGRAVADHYLALGATVVAVDDAAPGSPGGVEMAATAEESGVSLELAPGRERLEALAEKADRIVLSPGVPPVHPVFAVAPSERMVAEIEVGAELAAAAGVPLVAVTGTNGKTTVTTLVTAILQAAGRRAVPAGNIGNPLVQVAAGGDGAPLPEVVVVEVSSFQLAWTTAFRPKVACWLNFAPDHLDWHRDLTDYARAKSRIWHNQAGDDLAVWNAEDPVVAEAAGRITSRQVAFGLRGGAGTYHVSGGSLLAPDGGVLAETAELPRALPHDLANALAASACAIGAGADAAACRQALARGVPMPHRIALVAERDGVAFYDDSKATTPSAVLAAVSGFASVVLIAGGRNKGLDLSAVPEALLEEERTGTGPGTGRLRAVVAIGEAAGEVVAAFGGWSPVERAASMDEAVAAAARIARPGDAVLLSPGCASFDWYRNYAERGDDFARAVRSLTESSDRRQP